MDSLYSLGILCDPSKYGGGVFKSVVATLVGIRLLLFLYHDIFYVFSVFVLPLFGGRCFGFIIYLHFFLASFGCFVSAVIEVLLSPLLFLKN